MKLQTTKQIILEYKNELNTSNVKDESSQDNLSNNKSNICSSTHPEPDHWDKGWAWFVVIGSSICNFVVFGFVRSVGIILNEVTARFEASSIEASLIIILHTVFTIISTPVVSHVTRRVSCRHLVMAGMLLISAGLMTTAYGDTLPWAYVGLGLLCGTGGGFVRPTSYIIINQYFKAKRSRAFGIASAGMGIGSIAFTPTLAYWFEIYGYCGALLLTAGTVLNVLVAGALMRPPPKATASTETTANGPDKTATGTETKNETKPIANKSTTNHYENTRLLSKSKQMSSKLKLLSNPTFIVYMLTVASARLPSFSTYLPAYGLEIGVSTGSSAMILSANGFMDITGRIVSGFVFDRVTHGRKRLYHSIAGVAGGMITSSVGCAGAMTSLLLLTLAQGFINAIFYAQKMETPFEYVDAQDMSDAVGMIVVSECLGTILGPIMQGTIKDTYGSHSLGYLIGGTCFSATLFVMLIDFIVRTSCMKKSPWV